MPKLLIFQHVPHEGLGAFEAPFREAGLELQTVESWREDLSRLKIEPGAWDGVVVMGGPMSANDADRLPFIREELRLIEETLKADLPFLGVCLGSQLLAKALGMRVYPGTQKEIGWYPLWTRPEARGDPLFGEFPPRLAMFQWHGETFELPLGAKLLASSEMFLHQAFRYGEKAYGLQFHAEMTPEMIAEWHEAGRAEIAAAGLEEKWRDIEALTARHIGVLNRCARQTARGFASLLK